MCNRQLTICSLTEWWLSHVEPVNHDTTCRRPLPTCPCIRLHNNTQHQQPPPLVNRPEKQTHYVGTWNGRFATMLTAYVLNTNPHMELMA